MEPFDRGLGPPLQPDPFREAEDEWRRTQITMSWGEGNPLSPEPWTWSQSGNTPEYESPTTSLETNTPYSTFMEELFAPDVNLHPETYEFFVGNTSHIGTI